MSDPNPFSAKLAEVRTAMEREEWARAIKTMVDLINEGHRAVIFLNEQS